MSDRFTIVKRGYDPSEVDSYIEQLETVIKSYKEKNNAINNALVSAQITADNIIKEANNTAGAMKSGVVAKLDAVTSSISEQKRMVKEFQDEYNRLVQKYLHEVNETEILTLYSKVQDLEEYIDGLSTETPHHADAATPPAHAAEEGSSWL